MGNVMLQLTLAGLPSNGKDSELEAIAFELARKLASKALLYISKDCAKCEVEIARAAYIVVSKL